MRPVISPVVPLSITSSEERWAAWTAKGAAHDRLRRRRLLIAVPTVGVVVAALMITYVQVVAGR